MAVWRLHCHALQVLERLRELARLEASMLFAEWARDNSMALPPLSERISVAIIRVGDALDMALERLPESRRSGLFSFVKESAPPVLFDDAERCGKVQALPWPYLRACITSGLSSRLVYREGLAFVEGLNEATLESFALSYLMQEQRVRSLAAQVSPVKKCVGSWGCGVWSIAPHWPTTILRRHARPLHPRSGVEMSFPEGWRKSPCFCRRSGLRVRCFLCLRSRGASLAWRCPRGHRGCGHRSGRRGPNVKGCSPCYVSLPSRVAFTPVCNGLAAHRTPPIIRAYKPRGGRHSAAQVVGGTMTPMPIMETLCQGAS